MKNDMYKIIIFLFHIMNRICNKNTNRCSTMGHKRVFMYEDNDIWIWVYFAMAVLIMIIYTWWWQYKIGRFYVHLGYMNFLGNANICYIVAFIVCQKSCIAYCQVIDEWKCIIVMTRKIFDPYIMLIMLDRKISFLNVKFNLFLTIWLYVKCLKLWFYKQLNNLVHHFSITYIYLHMNDITI